MTIRSKIRPIIYRSIELTLTAMFYAMIGIMLLVVIIVTSFFWIPLAFCLWFEEKPVWTGVQDWFLNSLLNPNFPFRGI